LRGTTGSVPRRESASFVENWALHMLSGEATRNGLINQ
jgi:hypothetical protein